MQADSILIANHNLTASAEIKIMGDSAGVWSMPEVEQTITYRSGILSAPFTQAAKRYWRISVSDSANTQGYLKLGRVFLGNLMQMPFIDPEAQLQYIDLSEKWKSVSGQTYGGKNHRRFDNTFKFPFISDAQEKALNALMDANGWTIPFFMEVWEESLDIRPSLYVTLKKNTLDIKKNPENGISYTATIGFEEEL